MVAIATNLRAPIDLMPIGKSPVIVVWSLLPKPHIKPLVHNDKSHPIGEIEQLRSRGIVARPNRIHAHFF